MKARQREALRSLQDRVLEKALRVYGHALSQGINTHDDPLFEGGPSLNETKQYLYPELEGRFRGFLKGKW